jgi:transposase
MNNTTIGVDLAKNVIQVCVFSQQKVISNAEMSVTDFAIWLAQRKPSTIVFEA